MNHDESDMLLDELHRNCPRISLLLGIVESNRRDRLALYGHGATLKGLDEALDYLSKAELSFKEDARLAQVSPLVARAVGQIESGLGAFFAGLNSLVFDAMRGAMEVEFLLRDFLLFPGHTDEWFAADANMRYRKFRPVKLRKRYQDWLGESDDLIESRDYGLHSENLHVSPQVNSAGPPGVSSENHPAQLRLCLAELVSHTGRLVIIVHRHWKGLAMETELTREIAPNLPFFEDAYSRSKLGVAMWWPDSDEGS